MHAMRMGSIGWVDNTYKLFIDYGKLALQYIFHDSMTLYVKGPST